MQRGPILRPLLSILFPLLDPPEREQFDQMREGEKRVTVQRRGAKALLLALYFLSFFHGGHHWDQKVPASKEGRGGVI